MWPIKKKASLPEEEITLLPEDHVFPELIPEELPSLQEPKKEVEITPKVMPKAEIVKERPERVLVEKFMKMDRFKGVLSQVNNIALDFENIEGELIKVVDIKDQRHEKINNLQNSLEDVSKKLMIIENTLFGG